MALPIMRGVIVRRILANYRVDRDVLAPLVPPPFRPQLVDGYGIAGLCLIRLQAIRPRAIAFPIGVSSENAAHRIAVEWDADGVRREGVFVLRRDTNAWLNTVVGGRLFPGEHHYARFTTEETPDKLQVQFTSRDGAVQAMVAGQPATRLPATSLFPSLQAASDFFARGALGYSVTKHPQRFDALALRTDDWQVAPLAIAQMSSSFFDDTARFPRGSIAFDCALVMRNIAHEWHPRTPLWGPAVHAQPEAAELHSFSPSAR